MRLSLSRRVDGLRNVAAPGSRRLDRPSGTSTRSLLLGNAGGTRLLSGRVQNDETELLALVGDVLNTSRDVLWALDLNHGDFF
ncbi:hypothetical protein [Streptomyces luteolifulvus]|uniref:hypothetical protein n=1 Tax=Streptomyces luteolifulvus TaxID=2615112 RepID=UPI002EDA6F18